MERKEISKAVISRLPRYYRYLGELIEEEYLEEGILVKAYVPVTIYDKVRSV